MEHRMASRASEYQEIRKLTKKNRDILRPKEVILTYQNKTGAIAYSSIVFLIMGCLLFSFLDTLFFLLGPRDSEGTLLGFSSQGLVYLFAFFLFVLFFMLRFVYNYIQMKRFVILVTNQRVIVKEGGSTFSFPYLDIVNVSVIPSWVGLVFGYGTLNITKQNGFSSYFYRVKNVNSTSSILNKLITLSVSKESERELNDEMNSKLSKI